MSVIRVENLGKSYRLGEMRKERYDTFRNMLVRSARSTLGRLSGRPSRRRSREEFWALRDVSLEVEQGQRLGIIGRNGAGKSTLLKLLSRITEPTEGRITLRGRVGSLLEVGTGFHPELTGRENIFLNGAVLGMSRMDVRRKFDEIVAFSEVEKFLDTPVKRYSSGMYVRLAFAVAAHLEPEILIVDEVLAVGDAQFRQKCLGKMAEFGKSGRTVLFVSHNMAAIENLCTQVVLLDGGRIVRQGPTREIITSYLDSCDRSLKEGVSLAARVDRQGSGVVRLTSFELRDGCGRPLAAARSGKEVMLALGWQCKDPQQARRVDFGISLHHEGRTLAVLYSSYLGSLYDLETTEGEFRFRLPCLPLAPGSYRVGGRVVVDKQESDWIHGSIGVLEVEAADFYDSGHLGFGSAAPLLLKGQCDVVRAT